VYRVNVIERRLGIGETMKIIKDPAWQFVAAVVAVIALIVTVSIYLISRPVKRLQVQILSNSPLISVNTDISPQIQILYKGKSVQTLSLILLRFENVGNEPIRESDYSEPIRILLSPNAGVGEVTVQETKPVGIDLKPTVNASNQVEIARALLNPGDQAVLKVLALNNDGTLKFKARILGVPDLEILSALKGSTQSNASASYWILFIGLAFAILIIISALIWDSKKAIEWRRSHLGFDPARYYYTQAQETILSKDKDTGRISNTIRHLGKASSWDGSYVQRAQKDPLFSQLQEYEKFKAVIDKYKRPESESNNTP
jgi:hypothetical protein